MTKKKSESRASSLFVVLGMLGFFFGTYNLIKIVIYNRTTTPLSSSSQPIIQIHQKNVKRPFHVTVTAVDTSYSKWQCRIMYYWYKRVKEMPGSDEMGGYTRILHSGKPDNLMDEIPTFVVDPLPYDQDMGYIVLNRPWAFIQWLEKATIEEEYILMAEPDHIFVNPLPNLARGAHPAAYTFFYIQPFAHEKLMRKFYPFKKGPVTNIQQIGSSPVLMKKSLLKKIAPTWKNVSIEMNKDKETREEFGWVLEMYGYGIASALHGVKHILPKDFMLQPPYDVKVGKKFIIHFTNECNFNSKGELKVLKISDWRFDKKAYLRHPPPRNFSLPPPGVPESVVCL